MAVTVGDSRLTKEDLEEIEDFSDVVGFAPSDVETLRNILYSKVNHKFKPFIDALDAWAENDREPPTFLVLRMEEAP